MGANTELLAIELAEGIATEALDEVLGRSHKSWGILFVAAVAGGFIALLIMRRRHRQMVTTTAGYPTVAPIPT